MNPFMSNKQKKNYIFLRHHEWPIPLSPAWYNKRMLKSIELASQPQALRGFQHSGMRCPALLSNGVTDYVTWNDIEVYDLDRFYVHFKSIHFDRNKSLGSGLLSFVRAGNEGALFTFSQWESRAVAINWWNPLAGNLLYNRAREWAGPDESITI